MGLQRNSVFVLMPMLLVGCLDFLLEDETPTKSKMEGVWAVTEAYDVEGDPITDQINFPITAFHLSSDNSVVSTAGPMTMYMVYGDSEYTRFASQVDQVFNYASLDQTGGEFFVSGGITDRFTLEMKLEGLPGQKALTEILDIIGIGNDWLDVVIYHKFKDVYVDFSDDGQTMTWIFDAQTTAEYNTKNDYGEYVMWEGWPVDTISYGEFVFTKQVRDLEDLVEEAVQNIDSDEPEL